MSTIQAATEQTGIPAVIKRNTVLLAIAQMAGWLAIQMLSTLGSIVAFRLTADERWAGIPLTLATLSAALVAPRAGRLMDSAGRRPVLQAGQAALALGSLIMGASVFFGSMGGFLAGTLLWGAGSGITALSRSAAADMYPASKRAQGMSLVVMGGAVGATLGPLLLLALSDASRDSGADPLITPWLALALLLLPVIASLGLLRPDPRDIGLNLASYYPGETIRQEEAHAPARDRALILRQYPVITAIAATALVQAGMVMLMVTAALNLSLHGHDDAVFGVMTGHFFGMLGLAIFIGRAADHYGRRSVIITGTLVFIVGAIATPIFQDPLLNGVALFLVGLGWSLCYVAGNAVLADATLPNERARILGTNDLIVGLTGALAALAGGLLLGSAGFLVVGTVGLVLGLVPLLLALKLKEPQPGRYQ